MTDTPRKTLTLKRKPPVETVAEESAEATQPREVKRLGKRIIRREERTPARPARGGKPGASRKPAHANKHNQGGETGPSPSEILAKELDQKLIGAYPVWAEFKPLAHGIENLLYDFMQENQPPASKRLIQRLLRMHCNHGKYLQGVIEHPERFDLAGEAQGEVSAAEREHATRTLEVYEQKKQRQ
ncbi:MAG: ProQ/FINO family protein [Thiolinea sp.]